MSENKKWLNPKEVFKNFNCGYKDLLIKVSNSKLNVLPISGEIYFDRAELEKIFDLKMSQKNNK